MQERISSVITIRGLPNSTPLALTATIPCRCRSRMFWRSVSATNDNTCKTRSPTNFPISPCVLLVVSSSGLAGDAPSFSPVFIAFYHALPSHAALFASKFPCVAHASPTTGFAVARPGNLSPILPASLVTNSYPPNIFPSPICTTLFSIHFSSSPIKSHLSWGVSPVKPDCETIYPRIEILDYFFMLSTILNSSSTFAAIRFCSASGT